MKNYNPYFAASGVHALVDGQFGSTGKGLFASYLAQQAVKDGYRFDAVISNAGPNSGHTFYHNGEKHVLKQLPTFAVQSALLGHPIPVFLSAGAVIDRDILLAEAAKYPDVPINVHRNAAVTDDLTKEAEKSGSVAQVAGTRSGTGAAIASKVMRMPNAIVGDTLVDTAHNLTTVDNRWAIKAIHPHDERYFMEVSQGFSLGLHDDFYPKVTSRECTVMQGLADARLPASSLSKTFMVIRTFPIRVGNVDGYSSGDCFPDQEELEWDDFPGVVPERTTVTQRIRRIFTFSQEQYRQALAANCPNYVLVNFMNYLHPTQQEKFYTGLETVHNSIDWTPQLLFGWGPDASEITPF